MMRNGEDRHEDEDKTGREGGKHVGILKEDNKEFDGCSIGMLCELDLPIDIVY